jgi:hypothetical protein
MPLILWSACWLVGGVSLTADLALRRRRQDDLRHTRYARLAEISLMVLATGGILNYFLNDHQVPGNHHLRMSADALQLAGWAGAIFSSIRQLAITRRLRSLGSPSHARRSSMSVMNFVLARP